MEKNERGRAAVRHPRPSKNGQLGGPTKIENRPAGAGTQQPRKAAEEPQLFTGLYDGHSHLGYLIPRCHGFEAVLPDGESLGLYNDEVAATRAVIARGKPVELRWIVDDGGPR
jgi:hypothetical protein